jgi:hypothetical protein
MRGGIRSSWFTERDLAQHHHNLMDEVFRGVVHKWRMSHGAIGLDRRSARLLLAAERQFACFVTYLVGDRSLGFLVCSNESWHKMFWTELRKSVIFWSSVGQPNTSRGPILIYRTPSGARYSVSFRRVFNFQDMNTV